MSGHAQHNLEDEKGAEEKDHYGVDEAAKRGAEASRKRRQVYSHKDTINYYTQ